LRENESKVEGRLRMEEEDAKIKRMFGQETTTTVRRLNNENEDLRRQITRQREDTRQFFTFDQRESA